MVRCPVHGMNPIAGCCKHVQTACLAATPLPTHVVIDGYDIAKYLCPACYAKAKSAIEGFRKVTEDDVLQFEVADTGVCLEHLEEWFKSTGMGTVGDAVGDARRMKAEP